MENKQFYLFLDIMVSIGFQLFSLSMLFFYENCMLFTARKFSEILVKHLREPFLIYDALGDLVSSIQFKKRETHPWKNVTFSKVAGL